MVFLACTANKCWVLWLKLAFLIGKKRVFSLYKKNVFTLDFDEKDGEICGGGDVNCCTCCRWIKIIYMQGR